MVIGAMELSGDLFQYDALVGRVMTVEDRTVGDPAKDFIVRYRGCLKDAETDKVYDQLTEALAPYNVTPLFRWDDQRHAVLLIPGKPKARPSNPKLNVLMFVLTVIAVIIAGAQTTEPLPTDPLLAIGEVIRLGWPYAVSLMAILLTHEFGHYLMSRRHGVNASLPYFVPFIPPVGTMGAVIVMKEQPKNRRQLLDIGLAGPLAGLVVAIIVTIIGLNLSPLQPLPQYTKEVSTGLEGNSILYLLLKLSVFGQLLPAPVSYGGVNPVLYWIRYLFTATPVPYGGLDVSIHPVAWAGWVGMLVTSFNLLPAGQLDGGHLIYVLIGKERAKKLFPFILGLIAILGIFYMGWWLWFVIIFFLGRVYDDPLDQITPLDPKRKALAIFGIIIFFLVFIPIPFSAVGGTGPFGF